MSFTKPATIGGLAVVGIASGYYLLSGSAPKNHVFTGITSSKTLRLVEAEDINHNVRRLRFGFDNPDKVSGIPVGSAVFSSVTQKGSWMPTLRPYTPVSDVNERGHIEFIIKRYPNGPVSPIIHGLKVGDSITLRGPIPGYQYTPNMHRAIGLVAGGAGITPCYNLIRNIVDNKEDKTRVSLVFANSTENDVLLKEELDELQKRSNGRLSVFHTVSKPSTGWSEGRGRVSAEMLKEHLPSPAEEDIKVFVCGPDGFYESVSGKKPRNPIQQGPFGGILKDLGYDQKQVHKF